jgi:hypothetical protein
VALIRTDVSEDRIASIFRVNECEQVQSEIVSSCIGGDSRNTTNSGNSCCRSVQYLLSSRLLSKNIKIRIYKGIS